MVEGARSAASAPDRARAALFGWLAVALVNAACVWAKLALPRGGVGARLLHHAFDAGQLAAAGLVSATLVGAVARLGPADRRARLALSLAGAAAAGALLLREDLVGLTGPRLLPSLAASAAAGCVVPVWAAACGAAGRWRWAAPFATGVALAAVNNFIFERAYLGLHVFATWMAAVAVTAGIEARGSVPLLGRSPARRASAVALLSVGAAAALVARPSSAVLLELYRTPGASLAPFVAKLHGASRGGAAVDGPWYRDRSGLPAVPPSSPPLVAEPPVVILLTVDCLRADLLAGDAYRVELPHLHALRDDGVAFTQARAPSPSTVPSITAIMTGRFFSQIYWSEQTGGGRQKLWPHEDRSPRLPALLREGGVPSALVMSGTGFAARFGMTDQFDQYLDKGSPVGIPAAKITDHLVARLETLGRGGGGPLFLYTHYFEPHAPYDRAGKEGEPFERYVREVALVDAEIGRLREELETRGLTRRTVLIVTGDHGEAFGEHGTHDHAVSLYDELIHVPLLFFGAGLEPRQVDAPVSLADLGPTVLDVFGLPTPATFLGESLVGALRGGAAPPRRRGGAAAGRRGGARRFPDGYKLLVDRRLGTTELYDLRADPGETVELSAARPEILTEKLRHLRAYFDAHAFRREGYETPYRP